MRHGFNQVVEFHGFTPMSARLHEGRHDNRQGGLDVGHGAVGLVLFWAESELRSQFAWWLPLQDTNPRCGDGNTRFVVVLRRVVYIYWRQSSR